MNVDLTDIRFRAIQYCDRLLVCRLTPINMPIYKFAIGERGVSVGTFIMTGATCFITNGDSEIVIFHERTKILIYYSKPRLAQYWCADNMEFIPSRIKVIDATVSVFHCINMFALANINIIPYLLAST